MATYDKPSRVNGTSIVPLPPHSLVHVLLSLSHSFSAPLCVSASRCV